MQSFLPSFNEKAIRFVKELEAEVDKPQFDLYQYSNVCTLDSLCGMLFV